jgi:hypothetical protein
MQPNGSLFMFNHTPQPLLQSHRLEELSLTNEIVMASLPWPAWGFFPAQ